ncbi:MAG: hypothetical protein E7262_08880 [Lachnospiraceae bacterium]|nr:hypothetical protein [Lachnospiraceae bacterium]
MIVFNLKLLDLVINNGIDKDDKLLLYEDEEYNIEAVNEEKYISVKKDKNYKKLMKIIGRD